MKNNLTESGRFFFNFDLGQRVQGVNNDAKVLKILMM